MKICTACAWCKHWDHDSAPKSFYFKIDLVDKLCMFVLHLSFLAGDLAQRQLPIPSSFLLPGDLLVQEPWRCHLQVEKWEALRDGTRGSLCDLGQPKQLFSPPLSAKSEEQSFPPLIPSVSFCSLSKGLCSLHWQCPVTIFIIIIYTWIRHSFCSVRGINNTKMPFYSIFKIRISYWKSMRTSS